MFFKPNRTPLEQFFDDVKALVKSTVKTSVRIVEQNKFAVKICLIVLAFCVLSLFEYLDRTYESLSDRTRENLDYFHVPDAVTLRSMIVYSVCIGYIVFKFCSHTRTYFAGQSRILRHADQMSEQNFFVASTLAFGVYSYNIFYDTINGAIVPVWLYVLTEDRSGYNYNYNDYGNKNYTTKGSFAAIVISFMFGVLQLVEYVRLVLSAYRDVKIVVNRHSPIRVVSGHHVQKKIKVEDENSFSSTKVETSFVVFGEEDGGLRRRNRSGYNSHDSTETNDYEVTVCKIDHDLYYNVLFERSKTNRIVLEDADFEGQIYSNRRRYIYKSAIFDMYRLISGCVLIALSIFMFERVIGKDVAGTETIVLAVLLFIELLHTLHIMFEVCVVLYTSYIFKRTVEYYSEQDEVSGFINIFERDALHIFSGLCVYSVFRETIAYFDNNSSEFDTHCAYGVWVTFLGFCLMTVITRHLKSKSNR